jgi:hypothetical protein
VFRLSAYAVVQRNFGYTYGKKSEIVTLEVTKHSWSMQRIDVTPQRKTVPLKLAPMVRHNATRVKATTSPPPPPPA